MNPVPDTMVRADSSGTGGPRQPAVEVVGLRKWFGDVQALAGLDFQVRRGTVFALLGPNGAGKTTAVRVLATLTYPDAGRVVVDGLEVTAHPRAVRARISLTGQYAALDEMQTGEENLVMIGRLVGLSRREAQRRSDGLLERFDLADVSRRRVATYSGGTRRRLDLAAGLVRRPTVMFLDEPTTGLDVRGRQAVWSAVMELADSGVTILLTTQYLEEADHLAHDIAIIDEGRVVAQGSAAALKRAVAGARLELVFANQLAFDEASRRIVDETLRADRARLTMNIATDGSARLVREALDRIDPERELVDHFSTVEATLDDVFLAVTSGVGGSDRPERSHPPKQADDVAEAQ